VVLHRVAEGHALRDLLADVAEGASMRLSGACSITMRSASASGMPDCRSDAICRVTAATCSVRCLFGEVDAGDALDRMRRRCFRAASP
jgi:hypothetical protein